MSQTSESGHNDPQITGDWRSADESRNCLQLAETNKDGVFAMRDTFDPQHVTYATAGQIQAFVQNASSLLIGGNLS